MNEITGQEHACLVQMYLCEAAAQMQQKRYLGWWWFLKKRQCAELTTEWEDRAIIEKKVNLLTQRALQFELKYRSATNAVSKVWIAWSYQKSGVQVALAYYKSVQKLQRARTAYVSQDWQVFVSPEFQSLPIRKSWPLQIKMQHGWLVFARERLIAIKNFFGVRMSPAEYELDLQQALRRISAEAFKCFSERQSLSENMNPSEIEQIRMQKSERYFSQLTKNVPKELLARLQEVYDQWQVQHKRSWSVILRIDHQYANLEAFTVSIQHSQQKLTRSLTIEELESIYTSARLELESLLLNQLLRNDANERVNELANKAYRKCQQLLLESYKKTYDQLHKPSLSKEKWLQMQIMTEFSIQDLSEKKIDEWLAKLLIRYHNAALNEVITQTSQGMALSALNGILYYAHQFLSILGTKKPSRLLVQQIVASQSLIVQEEAVTQCCAACHAVLEELKKIPIVAESQKQRLLQRFKTAMMKKRIEHSGNSLMLEIIKSHENLAEQYIASSTFPLVISPIVPEDHPPCIEAMEWKQKLMLSALKAETAELEARLFVLESMPRFRKSVENHLQHFQDFDAWLQNDEAFLSKKREAEHCFRTHSLKYHPDKLQQLGDYYIQTATPQMKSLNDRRNEWQEYLACKEVTKVVPFLEYKVVGISLLEMNFNLFRNEPKEFDKIVASLESCLETAQTRKELYENVLTEVIPSIQASNKESEEARANLYRMRAENDRSRVRIAALEKALAEASQEPRVSETGQGFFAAQRDLPGSNIATVSPGASLS